MKKEKASNKALIHIICCLVLLTIFVITINRVSALTNNDKEVNVEVEDVVPLKPMLKKELLKLNKIDFIENENKKYDSPRIIEKDINYYIKENIKTLTFFSEIFGFDIEFIKQNLIEINKDVKEIEPTNIGSIKNKDNTLKIFDTKEYGIVEYFYYLVESYPENRNKKLAPYTGGADYVEKLIMYYTNIYTNVDRSVALSIGAAESGYYKVKYMLKKNNIYGGMTSKGLIKHDNIELGVLKYVRMLSKNYYGKGLITLQSIGKVYCPTFDENGNKVASKHWINLVNKAQKKYNSYKDEITIEDIINY
ncbi:MAG: hypothetical protein IJD92_00655 [Bacilli bacterium]|nr:hypothetical protein [Bacilli bacterium]